MSDPREDADRGARPDGDRAARDRRTRARRDRRTQWSVVALAAVVGVVAGSLGTTRDHAARALTPSASTTAPPAPARAHTVLFAHVGADHRLDLLVVAGVSAGGRVGSVVFVPTTTLVQVPAFDTQPLLQLPLLGDNTLLRTALGNALGLRFDQAIVIGNTRLTRLLAPAQRLDVTFGRSVEVNDAAGTLAFTQGRAHISASDATRLVIGPATGGSLEHLVTVQAVLEGWFARLRDPAIARATERVVAAASAFTDLAHAQVVFDTLPVDVLSSGSVTRYELRQPAADQMARSDFPYALFTKDKRPRVEILNGTGAIALTQAVARKIVPAGAEITLTGNVPGFGVKHTSVVYYRQSDLAAARRVAAALGVGSVALGNVPIDVVDLTVVVGSDFHPKRT